MIFLEIIVKMIWLMLPAYLANPAAAIGVKRKAKSIPIDFELSYKGKRILGDGKTYRGFFSGVIFGILVALAQNTINRQFFHNTMPFFNIASTVTLPFGAMLGDLTASFIKRRIGFERGQAWPFVDQLPILLAGAWIITFILTPLWFLNFLPLK